MKELVKFFIENYKLTIVVTLFAIIFGTIGIKRINSEDKPAVAFAMATVTTIYDGASAEEIETKITKPIEDEIRSIVGIKDVVSTSQAGRSLIMIRADIDNIVVEDVMNDLQKAVDRVSKLPADLKETPSFMELKAEEFAVLQIAVIGSNIGRLRDQMVDDLKDEIEDHSGVLRVEMTGHREREFIIRLNYKKLNEYHIGIDEVIGKIKGRNRNFPGGNVKENGFQQLVRVKAKIQNENDLKNVVIRSNFSGQKIYLKDIARVKDSMAESVLLTRYNGKEAAFIMVKKKGGVDTLSLVAQIKKTIEFFQEKYEGQFEIVLYQNEGTKVEDKMKILASNAVTGLVLVVFFLFLFLPGRIGLSASMSLPIAVFIVLGITYIIGFTLNTVTVLALVIALGMLVDNSVVISENFSRFRREGLPPNEAALKSITQLWLPITGTAFTTIAAFLPMLVTKGVMGQFLMGIPIVVTIALLVSLLESFFLLPMRLVKFGGKVQTVKENVKGDWFTSFERKFTALMRRLVSHRYWVALIFLAIVGSSFFFIFVTNRVNLFPAENTELYRTRVQLAVGTTLQKTDEVMVRVEADIQKIIGPYIDHIVATAGKSGDGIQSKGFRGDNVGQLHIFVNEHTKYNVKHTVILKKLRDHKFDYVEKIFFECDAHGPPVGDPVSATLRLNNGKALAEMAKRIMARLKKEDGVFDVEVDEIIGDDEVFVDINYEKADRLGLDVNSIGNTVRTAIAGKRVSNVTLNNKKVEMSVRYMGDFRKNLNSLYALQVMDMRGNLIPLKSFVKLRVETGAPQIKHYDYKRSKKITANIDEKKISAIRANMIFKEEFQLHKDKFPDVSLVFGGMAESVKESLESLFSALTLSLIGIFALLVFLFKSYLRPAIIMTTIPLGLFGFSIAFALHGREISFLALIGIIGLGGIIVNSGIILISFIDDMKKEGGMPLEEILVKASTIRLRAVLVSSLTTISGLLPTAYGIGGVDATLVPMTLAMAWGLTSGTILTLAWVPCAYAILEDFTALMDRLVIRFKARFFTTASEFAVDGNLGDISRNKLMNNNGLDYEQPKQ